MSSVFEFEIFLAIPTWIQQAKDTKMNADKFGIGSVIL